MKYCLGITLILASALSLEAAPREPNRKHVEKMAAMRRSRGMSEKTAVLISSAAAKHHAVHTDNEIVVVGSIAMPNSGELEGTGTGFRYIANAQTGTVVITFDELASPVVTATIYDLETTRSIQIAQQTEHSVTLYIDGYIAGNPAIVEFNAIQFENA